MKIWIGCGNGSAMGTSVPLILPLDVNTPPIYWYCNTCIRNIIRAFDDFGRPTTALT